MALLMLENHCHTFNDSKGGSPTLNLTNDILIFARLTDGNIGGTYYPNWDLYISYLIDGEWTEPANMGPISTIPIPGSRNLH